MFRLFRYGVAALALAAVFYVAAPLTIAEESGEKSFPTIISLSPAFTEIVFYLGKGDCLIGRTDVCDYPPAAKKLPVVGSFGNPQLEKILRLHPDLVVANDLINPNAAAVLHDAGIDLFLQQCHSFADYRALIQQLGARLLTPQQTAAELQRIDDELQKFAALPPTNKSALVVISLEPLLVAGGESLPAEILRHTQIRNIAEDIHLPYFKCSFDWLLRHQPDFIIWDTTQPFVAEQLPWREMTAVKNQHVVIFNFDLISRPGPRMFTGVLQLREAIMNNAKEN